VGWRSSSTCTWWCSLSLASERGSIMLFPMLGAALYCLIVYSRSPVVKDGDAKAVNAAIT